MDTDNASAPVIMLVNSSELRSTDFHLAEVIPLELETVTRGDRRTFGEAERNLQAMGTCMFVLSMENDNDFRSQCE